ncbi:hypothetical protein BC830DRAFT_314930 [Chytriomyces sp. MP71]|nr:hypothetical protein BC830DRAFT_314930 [Chytriomyces sp. MP71]
MMPMMMMMMMMMMMIGAKGTTTIRMKWRIKYLRSCAQRLPLRNQLQQLPGQNGNRRLFRSLVLSIEVLSVWAVRVEVGRRKMVRATRKQRRIHLPHQLAWTRLHDYFVTFIFVFVEWAFWWVIYTIRPVVMFMVLAVCSYRLWSSHFFPGDPIEQQSLSLGCQSQSAGARLTK